LDEAQREKEMQRREIARIRKLLASKSLTIPSQMNRPLNSNDWNDSLGESEMSSPFLGGNFPPAPGLRGTYDGTGPKHSGRYGEYW
jgi:hypothetical protein